MENRLESPRWQKRFEVILRYQGERIPCYLVNLSNEGMEVRSRARLSVNDEVSVRIITLEGQAYRYLGEVRWWRPLHGEKMGEGIYRYGLRHLAVDPDHAHLMEYVKYDPGRRQDNQRVEVELPVNLITSRDELEAITQNLSAGGAFIRLEEVPPPYRDEVVKLDFAIPDPETEIQTRAKIIHLLQPTWAQKLGLMPGVGIRFLDLSEAMKENLQEFVKKMAPRLNGRIDEDSPEENGNNK